MAAFNKFDCLAEDLAEKVHNLGSDTLKILLTNTAPSSADIQVDTDLAVCTVESTSGAAELAASGGYSKGGSTVSITSSAQSGGAYKLVASDLVFTAVGGTIGPFRYVVLYNGSSRTSATRAPIGWWDYGASLTLNAGETFTVDANPATGILQL